MAVTVFSAACSGKTRLRLAYGASQPASPRYNTLWLDTSDAAGAMAIQATAPATIGGRAVTAGDLWLQTAVRGTLMVCHGGAAYAVVGAFLHTGAAWVPVNALYYNGASWVMVQDSATVLLLHGENDGTYSGFRDASQYERPVTASGNVAVSGAQAKFGAGSLQFGAAAGYLSCGALSIGTGAFTLEAWAWVLSVGTNNRTLYSIGGSGLSNGAGLTVVVKGGSGLVRLSWGTTTFDSALPLTTGTWHHVAVTGNGGADGSRTCHLYVDGTQIAGGNINYNLANNAILVGRDPANTVGGWYGYLDEVRVSTVERWTGAFTPPEFAYA